jgi:hypothetical protein
MMKLTGLSLLLMIVSSMNAMQQRVPRSQMIRIEHVIEYTDHTKVTGYFETGYNESGPEQPRQHTVIQRGQGNSLKDVLYRNFITSNTATAGFLLLTASALGLAGLESHNDRMQRFNHTSMCPSPDYYNVKITNSMIMPQFLCFAGAGAALCCRQCIKAGKECCTEQEE